MDINCILACGLSSEVTILLCLLCNISPLLSRRAVKKVLWTLRWPIIMQVWVTYIFKKLVFLFEKLMTNKNYDYPVPLLYASIGFWATFVSVFQVCNSRIIVPTPCCFFVGTGPTRKLFASTRILFLSMQETSRIICSLYVFFLYRLHLGSVICGCWRAARAIVQLLSQRLTALSYEQLQYAVLRRP